MAAARIYMEGTDQIGTKATKRASPRALRHGMDCRGCGKTRLAMVLFKGATSVVPVNPIVFPGILPASPPRAAPDQ